MYKYLRGPIAHFLLFPGSLDEGVGHVITTIQPLIFSSLLQPHFFVTCSPHDQKLEVSVYDLTLSLAGANQVSTKTEF